ncbi:unnamed protein product [Urochloa humidicola]
MVYQLVAQERISLLTLQETKLNSCNDALILSMLGTGFDYYELPAIDTCGGILLAWKRDVWSISCPTIRNHTITAKVSMVGENEEWWITCVYGPQSDEAKVLFLQELSELRVGRGDRWLVCGDFNLIYKAEDKNNSRLNRTMMNRFRHFLDATELMELHLHGRLYTWSNERASPTLERIDRAFVTDDWADSFPDHNLTAVTPENSTFAIIKNF